MTFLVRAFSGSGNCEISQRHLYSLTIEIFGQRSKDARQRQRRSTAPVSTHRNLTPPKGFSGSLPSSLAAPSAPAVVEAVIFGTTDTLFSCLDLKKEEL